MTSSPMTSLINHENFIQRLKTTKNHHGDLVDLIKAVRGEALSFAQKKLEDKTFQGEQCAHALAQAHDLILRELFTFITQEIFPCANPTKAEKITLLATGGYGRALLAPFSDIDLLFLQPYKSTPWSEQVIESMLKILWDCGLKVGHNVRSVKNAATAASADIVICTALLDARLLAGDEALYQTFQKQFARTKHKITAKRFVKAKLEERDARHHQAGQSRYLVEPNIKNGKGGLRDLQTLWWLANFCYDARDGRDLLKLGLFSKAEYQQLHKCEAMLWEVRCHLHFLCDEAQERLSFHLQRGMAERMGYHHDAQLLAVELFMKHYFRIAKQAGDLTRILCAQLEEREAKPRPRLSRFINRAFELSRSKKRNFSIEGGRLKIRRKDAFDQDPINLLRFFHTAAQHDLKFHPEALSQVRHALKYVTAQLRSAPAANQLFLDILTSRKNPARILRVMNDAGLLGRFIPDFGRIVAQMQFNMYHHYTVDEHLLHAVGQIADIERNGLDTMKLAAQIFREIGRQEHARAVLYVSVLTHDIAKGRKGDHSEEGAKIAYQLARRFGLGEEQAATAEWLVKKHLLMSDAAQKRDLADPKTVRDFAAQVKTHERLNLLCALTIVDIRAVGPGVWNDWKGQLLETLYKLSADELDRTDRQSMSPSISASMSQAARKMRREVSAQLEDWPQNTRRDYLKLHSDAYWLNVARETQIRHAHLWRTWGEATPFIFSVEDIKARAVSEMILITQDHPGLFSRVVGAFEINGLNVIDARIFTSRNGLAFDTFWVQTSEQTAISDPQRADRIRQTVVKVLAGKLSPPDEIRKHENRALSVQPSAVFQIAPKVSFDNQASDDHTVIEVEGLDRAGLLHALALQIFRQGLVLSSAHIATYGERAVDVFYVKDSTGQKITSTARQKNISAALTKAITAR